MNGTELADLYNSTAAGTYLPGLGHVKATFPWIPDRYKDENGDGNALVVHADGFPMIRVHRDANGTWRWALNVDPKSHPKAKHRFAKQAFGKAVWPHLRERLDLPEDFDPMNLIGQSVAPEDFIRFATPSEIDGRWG